VFETASFLDLAPPGVSAIVLDGAADRHWRRVERMSNFRRFRWKPTAAH